MKIETVADKIVRYEQSALASLPEEAYEFIAAGSDEEISAQEAVSSWRRFRLRPRVLRDVSSVDTSASVLGAQLAAPVLVAPTAYHMLAHSRGEVETARGVSAALSLMIVPTRATALLKEVAAALTGPWWFQVYFMRERELTRRLVLEAAELGAAALVMTGDAPLLAQRPRSALPPVTREQHLVNIQRYLTHDVELPFALTQDPSIGHEMIAWLRELTGLPVIVKGVLRGDDAAACVDAGAAGIIVSNHGGRQLDRAVPPAAALAEVASAVGTRADVLVDGGIRSGIDVLIALALGARAVLLGRPVLWALASDGADGVETILRGLRGELAEAMALAGATRVDEVDASLIWREGAAG